jgi:hypothetical protein
MHFAGSNLSTDPKTAQSAKMHLQNFATSHLNHAEGVSVCAKRNFIARKPTSL